ncbi:hypothetical protein SAMN05216359_1191 [Roseateles sp. YR242]|uniref:hypothetical protein n=1 Tax=Roseateles sp. YR242 TaxID=1855305 RepID=UPI0008D5C464|nr:hypothetical protein [Roseateles sp. YR242]SEL83657.1 hypothetical protein SAMN05216359_1191 [Roseateles sp. YR242]
MSLGGWRWIGICGVAASFFALVIYMTSIEHNAVRLADRSERGHTLVTSPQPSGPSLRTAESSVNRKVPSGWNSMAVNDNLGEIYDAARNFPDSEFRHAALRIASFCGVLPTTPMDIETAAVVESNPNRQKRLMVEVDAARQRLAAFCRSGSSDAYMDDIREKRVVIDGVSMKFRRGPKVSDGTSPNQWETTVLANPEAFPIGLDGWLETNLPKLLPSRISENKKLTQAIAEDLYGKFLGESPDGGVRSLYQCAILLNCPNSDDLTQDQWQEVEALSLEIEAKIRQQRWGDLATTSK